jgi:hypothetical protein
MSVAVNEPPSHAAWKGLSPARMRSDIFQIPFSLRCGTKEKTVGMSLDAIAKSRDFLISGS